MWLGSESFNSQHADLGRQIADIVLSVSLGDPVRSSSLRRFLRVVGSFISL